MADDKTTKTPEQPVTDSGPGKETPHNSRLNYSIFTRVQKTGYISVRDGSFAFIGLLFL